MSENKYPDYAPDTDARSQAPTFDEMVAMIEKLFKDYLKDVGKKAFTDEQIEEGWQRYKTLNHLYQDEQPKPAGAPWVKGAPKELKQCFARVPSVIEDDVIYDAVIWPTSNPDYWWALGHGFKFSIHKDKITEYLDESGVASNNDAIEFAEWIKAEGWNQRASIDWAKYETIYSDVSVKTTSDLYNIWQQSKSK